MALRIGHWNYTDSTVNNIYLMSMAEDVGQFLNYKSLGKGDQRSQFIFTFAKVTWQSGTIMGVGLLAVVKPLGKTACNTRCHTDLFNPPKPGRLLIHVP